MNVVFDKQGPLQLWAIRMTRNLPVTQIFLTRFDHLSFSSLSSSSYLPSSTTHPPLTYVFTLASPPPLILPLGFGFRMYQSLWRGCRYLDTITTPVPAVWPCDPLVWCIMGPPPLLGQRSLTLDRLPVLYTASCKSLVLGHTAQFGLR